MNAPKIILASIIFFSTSNAQEKNMGSEKAIGELLALMHNIKQLSKDSLTSIAKNITEEELTAYIGKFFFDFLKGDHDGIPVHLAQGKQQGKTIFLRGNPEKVWGIKSIWHETKALGIPAIISYTARCDEYFGDDIVYYGKLESGYPKIICWQEINEEDLWKLKFLAKF